MEFFFWMVVASVAGLALKLALVRGARATKARDKKSDSWVPRENDTVPLAALELKIRR